MEKGIIRIAFTGPESCGKTTLATWCAAFFNWPLAQEYARTYLEARPHYEEADLLEMAKGQLAWWPSGSLVADTEMHVFQIWSSEKYHRVDEQLLQALNKQQFDHYFLCAPDIPWEPDPLRENPSDRERLLEIYQKELIAFNRPFTILKGDLKTRQELIKRSITKLLNS
jgi:nicotinamide riboside kinase